MTSPVQAPAALRVRVYNVLFGDAILVSVPEASRTRHILIDVGNSQGGRGGRKEVFEKVVADIAAELGGRPIDLYVMTHEHMDHIKGLLYAQDKLGVELGADYAWLTASADPDYGTTYPNAVKQRKIAALAMESTRASLAAAPDQRLKELLLNNDYRETEKCVEHLRTIAKTTSYVHRGSDLTGKHPFEEAKLTLWAPEADTSVYYGRFTPAASHARAASGPGPEDPDDAAPPKRPAARRTIPPPGVDASAFQNLLDWRALGHSDNMFAIDRAANNTSIVFSLEWRGWTLLFAGDAEIRSWRTMAKFNMLRPVHLLKVAHHGSVNGTPKAEALDAILPVEPHDGRDRYAVVSTCLKSYPGVPDDPTLALLKERVTHFKSTLDAGAELYFDVLLEAGGPTARSAKQDKAGPP